jgi:hypothetical protein
MILWFWKFSLGNFKHLDVIFVINHKVNYNEKNDAYFQKFGLCRSNEFGLFMIKS